MAKKKDVKGKPLPAVMLDLIIGYWVSQLVHVVAKLGLADHLKGGPKSPAELARSTGTDPQVLHRVLRALASVGGHAALGPPGLDAGLRNHDGGRLLLAGLGRRQ